MDTTVTLLSSIKPERSEWLWQGRIPLSELTIVEGHPGTNKSLLGCDLAARLTRGEPMPCPGRGGRPRSGGAVFLVGEDSLSKTVRPRLTAANADLDRIAILEDVVIPDDIDRIGNVIEAVDAQLIVVDTLNDFLNCNVLGNQQVRKALRPLRELAEKASAAVMLLRHFIKNGSGHSLLRGGGSVGITAMARSQIKLFSHPDDPNLRVLMHDKCNLAPLAPSLLFEVASAENNVARLNWHGECNLTIADLEKKGKGSPTLEAAERFLREKLADGPKEVNWLVTEARGICGKRTLDEAKKSLKLKTLREGKGHDHKVSWSL